MRPAARLAVFALALALSGCGGDSGESESERAARIAAQKAAQQRAAEDEWRAGFSAWSVSMMTPALGVSAVMTDSLDLALEGDPATRRRLDSHLNALRRCMRRLERIGRAPPRFRRARATGASACDHLTAGAELVDLGIEAYQGGLGEGLLTRAADSIGKGVELLGTANKRLPKA